MAHADYNCCAVCDSKLAYSNQATTKEEICSYCVAKMARLGVIVGSAHELIEWINREDRDKIESVLSEAKFRFCIYPNEVDMAVVNRGISKGERGIIAPSADKE